MSNASNVSEEKLTLDIKRILVAMDTSAHSLAALEAAADLASRFDAELQGLFVEDVNLLRMAELPFAWEVSSFTGVRRRIDGSVLQLELRAQAGMVRRNLVRAAERSEVRWSFRVARGPIAVELLAAAAEADLIILGKAGASLGARRRMGSTTRAVVSGASCLAMVLQRGSRLRLPILVVYDGSPLARKALAAAAVLTEGEETPPLVLILADDPNTAEELHMQAEALLGERTVEARYRSLSRVSTSRLAQLVRAEGCGTLVMPAKSALLQDETLLALLDEIDIPVLLVP